MEMNNKSNLKYGRSTKFGLVGSAIFAVFIAVICTAGASISVASANTTTTSSQPLPTPVVDILSDTAVEIDWIEPANPTNAKVFYTIQISAASAAVNRHWNYRQNRALDEIDDSKVTIKSPSFAGKTRWFRVIPHFDGVAGAAFPVVEVNFRAPTKPDVTVTGANTADLEWEAPAGRTPLEYTIEASANGKRYWVTGRATSTEASVELSDSAGKKRYFRVVPQYLTDGVSVAGTPSATSELAHFPGHDSVTNLVVRTSLTGTQRLSWTAPTDATPTDYQVDLSNAEQDVTLQTRGTNLDFDLTDFGARTWAAKVTPRYSGNLGTASATTTVSFVSNGDVRTEQPENLRVVNNNTTPTSVELTWDSIPRPDDVRRITYAVEVDKVSAAFTDIWVHNQDATRSTSFQFEDDELAGQTLFFRIVPYLDNIPGQPSNSVKVHFFETEAPAVTVTDTNQAELTWRPTDTDNETTVSFYRVETRATDSDTYTVYEENFTPQNYIETNAVVTSADFIGTEREFRIIPFYSNDGTVTRGIPSAVTTVKFASGEAVRNVDTFNNQDDSIEVYWDEPAGASVPPKYLVEVSLNNFGALPDVTPTVVVLQTNTPEITLQQSPALSASAIWYVRIKPLYGNNVTGPAAPVQKINFNQSN